MTDDLPQIKARLEGVINGVPYEGTYAVTNLREDIRAALQRVEHERGIAATRAETIRDQESRIAALRQRVEELERQRVEGVVALRVCENAATPRPGCECVTCTVKRAENRAEAAESKLAICESTSAFRHEEIKRYQAEVARLREALESTMKLCDEGASASLIFWRARAALREEGK